MNILYVGMYRQGDGWGNSSRNTVRSLDLTGHNLAIRPVYLNRFSREAVDDHLLALESKSLDSYDVLVQHVLPDYFVRDTRFGRNIGFFHSETTNLQYTGWVEKCNLMDEIWVSSRQEQLNLEESGVRVPVHVVPMGFDTEKYQGEWPFLDIPDAVRTYNFYTVADFTERKNLDDLITAFHLAFGPEDPVKLIIKTGGTDYDRIEATLKAKCKAIKDKLRVRSHYQQEILVIGHLEEANLYGLHQQCHCFVLPSYGESVCIPMVDAIGFGNRAIVTQHTGMSSYFTAPHWDDDIQPQVELIHSSREPVLTNNPPLAHIYSAREEWQKPSLSSLVSLLQYVWMTRGEQHFKGQVTTYAESAETMKEVLLAS